MQTLYGGKTLTPQLESPIRIATAEKKAIK